MASLLSVLRKRFDYWPDDVRGFRCDPDGEVRGINGTHHDFYPDDQVDWVERSSDFNGRNGVVVTKKVFEQGE